MYLYGLIGNCEVSSLIDKDACMIWLCLPFPDSPPYFGKLLDDEGGGWQIIPKFKVIKSEQRYLGMTNILQTIFYSENGPALRVTDFSPRYRNQSNEIFRPTRLCRKIERLESSASYSSIFHAVDGWSKKSLSLEKDGPNLITTSLDKKIIIQSSETLQPKNLFESRTGVDVDYFALSYDISYEGEISSQIEHELEQTDIYWKTWVKHCRIPAEFQSEVIRSALCLKLHCYESTGAILASLTTSLPEEIGAGRNWDYRYCWLRDAYFTLAAFHQIGHFEELEGILSYLVNIIDVDGVDSLKPVYRIDGSLPLPEKEISGWAGFSSSPPVRENNQAAEHVQNDVYGEVFLSISPLFYDDRFAEYRLPKVVKTIHYLAKKCHESLNEPDAGLWELRSHWRIHSFTLLICWAALDRYVDLISKNFLDGDLEQAKIWRDNAYKAITESYVDGMVTNSAGDPTPDASLLLLPIFNYPDFEVSNKTVFFIKKTLAAEFSNTINNSKIDLDMGQSFFYRYKRADDFGRPVHPFIFCSYWMICALVKLGHQEEAKLMFRNTLVALNHLGLISEHFDIDKKMQTGNFPQCYSHVGLIQAAFAVSNQWF